MQHDANRLKTPKKKKKKQKEGESEKEMNEDSRCLENKRKSSSVSSESSQKIKKVKKDGQGPYVVGMRTMNQVDGVFSNPHELGRYLQDNFGVVKSVRITRSGLVIIDCVSKKQAWKLVDSCRWFNSCDVVCFRLGTGPMKKGVISGVPVFVDADIFVEVEGVIEARRMNRFRDGVREASTSVCLSFEGEIPDRVLLDSVSYRVREYERAPLRCFSCQEYGHVAAVCRGERRCGRCGGDECWRDTCKEEAKCLHCEGSHNTGSAQCPRRGKEIEVSRIREEKGVSYAEAVKCVERKEKVEVQNESEKKSGTVQTISVEKKGFVAFIAFVINCALEMEGKSERIKMVLDAARKFLNIEDVTGKEVNDIMKEAFAAE